ncbi:hypothetical protein LMG27177_00343 [Paraburkholderia fynbosensis]|uniref:Uncharacterized protein n=1 Tax=Paraburkholderia fynbosensis TaxID=1200993 RepID=A0A6J5FCC7_9BURK|nr:hypothetical protein LMG27177_00343 [Paraburkholderia fynbosensis]
MVGQARIQEQFGTVMCLRRMVAGDSAWPAVGSGYLFIRILRNEQYANKWTFVAPQ